MTNYKIKNCYSVEIEKKNISLKTHYIIFVTKHIFIQNDIIHTYETLIFFSSIQLRSEINNNTSQVECRETILTIENEDSAQVQNNF